MKVQVFVQEQIKFYQQFWIDHFYNLLFSFLQLIICALHKVEVNNPLWPDFQIKMVEKEFLMALINIRRILLMKNKVSTTQLVWFQGSLKNVAPLTSLGFVAQIIWKIWEKREHSTINMWGIIKTTFQKRNVFFLRIERKKNYFVFKAFIVNKRGVWKNLEYVNSVKKWQR